MTSTPTMASSEVCELAQISYRQLTHWVNRGYLAPLGTRLGSGHSHEFSREVVRRAVVMGALTRLGFSPAVAAQLADTPSEALA